MEPTSPNPGPTFPMQATDAVTPVPGQTISMIIRSDYIHEAKLNAVVEAIRRIIPANLLEGPVRIGNIVKSFFLKNHETHSVTLCVYMSE